MALLTWLFAAFVLTLFGRPLGARLARALHRPRPPHAPHFPFLLDLALSITGALTTGLAATLLGFGGLHHFDFRAFLVACLGAALAMVGGRGVGERGQS